MALYNNSPNISSPPKIVVQKPVDDRLTFENLASITSDIAAAVHTTWYIGMTIYIKDLSMHAVWLKTTSLPSGITTPLHTPTGYPTGYAGYTGSTFAFYELLATPKPHTHDISEIPNADNDFYLQSTVDTLLNAKQNALPVNTTPTISKLLQNINGVFTWITNTFLTAAPVDGDMYAQLNATWTKIWNFSIGGFSGAAQRMAQLPSYYVLPAGAYDLPDPNTIEGHILILIHDGNGGTADLNGFAINGNSIPYLIPDGESISVIAINGNYRFING